MENNEKLNREIQQILQSRLSSESEAVHTSLKAAEKQLRSGSQKRPSWPRKWAPLLAAACVIALLTLFLFPRDTALYELPEMRSEIVRGAGEDEMGQESQRYEEAVAAFNARNYSQSTGILRELHSADPQTLQYQYYYGLSLIGEENYVAAVSVLEDLAQGQSVFKNEASYYIAIAFYEQGQVEEAVHYLKAIPPSSPIYPDVERLLEALTQD